MKKGFLGFDDMKFDIVYKVSDAEIQTLCKKPSEHSPCSVKFWRTPTPSKLSSHLSLPGGKAD